MRTGGPLLLSNEIWYEAGSWVRRPELCAGFVTTCSVTMKHPCLGPQFPHLYKKVLKTLSPLHLWQSLGRTVSFPTAAAAKSLQSCPTLCDAIDGSPPGSPSLGFSRQEYWSGLPFPSPIPSLHTAAKSFTGQQAERGNRPQGRASDQDTTWTPSEERLASEDSAFPKALCCGYRKCYLAELTVSKNPAKNLPADARDAGSIPGLGRSLGEGNGNPLQYSCLENPMDRGVWWATDDGVIQSRTRLKRPNKNRDSGHNHSASDWSVS